MAFENIRPPHIEVGTIVRKVPITPDVKQMIGESLLTRLNPDNESHIFAAHRLDRKSAEAGLLTTDGKPELLSAEDFRNWTHAGDTRENPWRKLDLVQQEGDMKATGFINSYAPERGVKKTLLEHGAITNKKAVIDEIEWYMPEMTEISENKIVMQHMSDRFKHGTDVVTHWVDVGDINDDIRGLHKQLGFKEVYKQSYMGEEEDSICFVADRSSFARAMLEQLAAPAGK
ncbi:MAG: hypothetical protein WAV51_05185 [Microgenomates group bacterium]